jgi:hypothetical protein
VQNMKQTINQHDFMDAFRRMDRDYYSYEAYQALFDWYEELDPDFELDVIGICCDWTEYTPEELESDYSNILSFDEWKEENIDPDEPETYTKEELKEEYIKELVSELERHTTVIKLSDTYLVLAF